MTPEQMLAGGRGPQSITQPSYNGGPNTQTPAQGQSASSGQQIAQQLQNDVQGAFQASQTLKDQVIQLAQSYPAGQQDFMGAAQLCDQISQILLKSLGNALGAMGTSAAMPTRTQGMGA